MSIISIILKLALAVLGGVSERLPRQVGMHVMLNTVLTCSYPGQFREDASVKRYVHELTLELGEYMEELSTALSMFKDIGTCVLSGTSFTFLTPQ